MRFPRIQFTLRTLGLFITVSAIVFWWWYPGIGTQCWFHRGRSRQGSFLKVERLTSLGDLVDYHDRMPDEPFGGTVPVETPPYVNFQAQDILLVPRPHGAHSLPTHVRLCGRLVVFRAEQPGDGDEGQEVIIPKVANVVFWSGNTLAILDVTVSSAALALLLAIPAGRLLVRRRHVTNG